jgi:hypothetical protein
VSEQFTSLVRAYVGQLLLLTRRMFRCSPVRLVLGVPVFLVNQVSFVLAMILPLKVIIMLGSDGIPRYFRFFITEQTRSAWMIGFVAGAIGMFVLYLISSALLNWLAGRGGERVLGQSRKTGLFDDQERFAADIFQRVISTWGTLAMAVGGVAIGLFLEWRLVTLVLGAIVLEFVLFSVYWNRFAEPEQAEGRERLIARRTQMLQNLSGVNVLILFAGLVVLLLTDPTMNFIVGVVLFLLARQILARSVRMFADANFFTQNRERIDALVHPGRHLRENRPSQRDSFEQLLMPGRRGRLIGAIGESAGVAFGAREWCWADTPGKAVAMFVATAGDEAQPEYRLKVKMRESDAGLARETTFHRSASADALGLSCEMVGSGGVFGRGFILLRSEPISPCLGARVRETAHRVRMRLWRHAPDRDLASRLLRSFPPLSARLEPARLGRLRLACDDAPAVDALDRLLEVRGGIVETLDRLPRVLTHSVLRPGNLFLTGDDAPVVLHWEAIRIDVIGADLVPADLDREYAVEAIAAEIGEGEWPHAPLPAWALPLVVHLAQIDRQIDQENYGAAMALVPKVLEIWAAVDGADYGASRISA